MNTWSQKPCKCIVRHDGWENRKRYIGFSGNLNELTLRTPTEEEAKNQIESYYNVRSGKFLNYQWGVTVTALARVRLQELIDLTYKDFIYADTDSVKIENGEKYKELLENYNKQWIEYAENCNVSFKAYTKKEIYKF